MKKFSNVLFGFMLSICFLLVPVTVHAATTHTQEEAVAWAEAQQGKSLDYDGVYGAQCVDLTKFYGAYLGVNIPNGHAYQYITNTPPAGWRKIQGAAIEPGDIVIWDKDNTNPYGHVAIAISSTMIMEQNYAYTPCTARNMRYNNYWGVWRPDFIQPDPVPDPLPDDPGRRTISDGDYFIVTSVEGYAGKKCLSFRGLPGPGKTDGEYTDAVLRSVYGEEGHLFTVTWLGNGFYSIKLKDANLCLDVRFDNRHTNADVQAYDQTSGEYWINQQWCISETEDGQGYSIQAKSSGYYLDLEGAITDEGARIRLWEGNWTPAERWYFIPWDSSAAAPAIPDGEYQIVPQNFSSMAVTGNSTEEGSRLATGERSDVGDAGLNTFQVKWLGEGNYEITNSYTGYSLDVPQFCSRNGTEIMLHGTNQGRNQQWLLRSCGNGSFNIISKCNGLYVDFDARSAEPQGKPILLWYGYGGEGQSWRFVPYVRTVNAESVTLDRNSLTVCPGQQVSLHAQISPENTTDKSLTWESGDASVASVDSDGKVTAKAVGRTEITVKTANGKTASCTVTVQAHSFAIYDGYTFTKDEAGQIRCYAGNGDPVINEFKCDGVYTYYFQYDGTAMRDRLTYHPDGVHIIYFDADGHEVFSEFANIRRSIAGDPVDDMCFFDVFGYMYVDTLTYDKSGTKLYYVNAYGVLERKGWFAFSGREFDAGLGFSGRAGGYGYANPDCSLLVNTTAYDWENREVYLQGDGHMFLD